MVWGLGQKDDNPSWDIARMGGFAGRVNYFFGELVFGKDAKEHIFSQLGIPDRVEKFYIIRIPCRKERIRSGKAEQNAMILGRNQ